MNQAMLIAGVVAGWLGWLVEYLALMGIVSLVKHFVMGISFQIWVALALAVILVVILIAWRNREPDEAPPVLKPKFHVWASVFWVLAIVVILSFMVGR